MTTRPGAGPLQYLAFGNGKRITSVVDLLPTDLEQPLRFTSHDRDLTVLGTAYKAVAVSGAKFDARQSNFRGGLGLYTGTIDGTNIVIDDMRGGRYRGARIRVRLVDWRNPQIVLSEQRAIIGGIKFSPTGWQASLESLTMAVRQPKAGRFDGAFTRRCPYQLGGEFCRADIAALTQFGVTVKSIVKANQSFTTWTSSWANGVQQDNTYREGEAEFFWAAPEQANSGITNTATAVGGTTVELFGYVGSGPTAGTSTWVVDQFKDKDLMILSAGVNGGVLEYHRILGNDDTNQITIQGTGFGAIYPTNTPIHIAAPSKKRGTVIPIGLYQSTLADPQIDLFFPTYFDIEVGETLVVYPGCDGLFTTCDTRFTNTDNFGGIDAFAPTAADLLRPPANDD